MLAGTWVTRDGGSHFVRAGTVADIRPGTELKAAYGGAGNLSAVITGPARSPEAALWLSREALSN